MAARISGTSWDGQTLLYQIEVEQDRRRWTTTKRYTDFVEIDGIFGKELAEHCELNLPSKGKFGLRHYLNIGRFNEQRREGLDQYLEVLVEQARSSKERAQQVATFLQATAGDVAKATASAPATAPAGAPDAGTPSGTPALDSPLEIASKMQTAKAQWERDRASSSQWRHLRDADQALAADIEKCAEVIASPQRFQNDVEKLFSRLRRSLLALQRGAAQTSVTLDEVPGKTLVWTLLMMVATQRSFYRNQVLEVVKALEASQAWKDALQAHECLCQVRANLAEK